MCGRCWGCLEARLAPRTSGGMVHGARCSSASGEESETRPQNEGRDGGQRPPSSAARPASPRLLPRACKVHFRARLGTATLPAPLRRLQLFLPKPQGAGRGRDRRCTEQRGASAERRARRLRGPHPARSPAPWPCRCFLHQREREVLGGARRRSPSRGQQVAGPGRAPQVGTLVAVPDVCLGVKKGRAPLRTPPEGASVRRLLTGGRGRGRDASQGLGTGPHSLQRRKPRASCHRAVLGTRQLLALREVSAASASAPRARPAVAPEAEVAEMRPRPAWRSGLSSDVCAAFAAFTAFLTRAPARAPEPAQGQAGDALLPGRACPQLRDLPAFSLCLGPSPPRPHSVAVAPPTPVGRHFPTSYTSLKAI